MRDHVVEAPDGRRLAVVELGDAAAAPVVFHHGTPGSRTGRHPDDSVYAGTRAIFYDRPGYGESDPQPGRDVAACAADVDAIADALGVDRFSVCGASGGGPHALACGALLGDRVERVAVVVGVAPSDDPELDFLDGMSELNVQEFGAARAGEDALAAFLEPFVEQGRTDPFGVVDAIAAELPEPDQEVLARPEVREAFGRSIADAVRQGARGWIDDDVAFTRPWGFALADVRQEVRLWQGELDVLTPKGHAPYLASKLPNAEFALIPGAAHMLHDETREIVLWLLAGRR